MISDATSDAERAELLEALYAFNMDRTGYRDALDLSCFVRDPEGGLLGGIDGFTWGGYAHIEALWVTEAHRGAGLGRSLLEAAEAEAAARGCRTIVLSSHEFQAPAFYAKLGYEVVGETGDTPVGHRQFTFQKRLDRQE